MSIARTALGGGPAYAAFNSANFHFGDDQKAEFQISRVDLKSSMYGDKADAYLTDRKVMVTGTPLEYASLTTLFPYLSTAIGARIFGDADVPLVLNSNNGDIVTVIAAAITKMPSLFLGVGKAMLGALEFTGLVGTGANPDDAASYYSLSTGSFTAPALTAGNIKQQRYSAAWGAVTGFTAIQAQDGWTVDWELDLQPIVVQGLTRDMKFLGLRAMAKCIPIGPTMAQINTNLRIQNTGASEGARAGATVNDLVITGSGAVVTVKKAALVSAGFVFGGKPLRNGEIGFMSTLDVSSGAATAVATIATS